MDQQTELSHGGEAVDSSIARQEALRLSQSGNEIITTAMRRFRLSDSPYWQVGFENSQISHDPLDAKVSINQRGGSKLTLRRTMAITQDMKDLVGSPLALDIERAGEGTEVAHKTRYFIDTNGNHKKFVANREEVANAKSAGSWKASPVEPGDFEQIGSALAAIKSGMGH